MPKSAPSDFVVNVEGIGPFTFSRRTIRLQLALDVEFARLSEGVALSDKLEMFVRALATIKALAVSTPDGWDPEDQDPFDSDALEQVLMVWGALREKEETFRKRPDRNG